VPIPTGFLHHAGPPRVLSDSVPSASQAGGSGLVCLAIGILLILVLIVILMRRRSARQKPPPTEHTNPPDSYASIPAAQLEADANERLVAADDSLKTSEQELTLATASYGAESTTEFAAALQESRADVTEAFRIKQLIDDDAPEDEPTRRAWFVLIVQRCDQADSRLDAQVASFDKLRDLQAHLETSIPALDQHRETSAGRVPGVENAYTTMRQRYADPAVAPISNSVAQVTERLTFVDRTLGQARDALAADRRSAAAVAVRAAEDALGQVDMLLDGVEKMGRDLDGTMVAVRDMLSEVESDVASGRAAVVASGPPPSGGASAGTVDLAATVAAGEQVATSVRAELNAGRPDPFRLLGRLEQANGRLDAALATIRDAATRAERARTTLDQTIPAVRAEIEAVGTFITTRRGAVGSVARTRLNEAERCLDQAVAMASNNPGAALGLAQRAGALAEQAGQLASGDVDGWSQRDVLGGAGGLDGAVLGGILLDSMLGGGRRRGGQGGIGNGGGTSNSGGISGLSGGFGWGGLTPGAFGGRGTRVRLR
jgi:hypothetical protein